MGRELFPAPTQQMLFGLAENKYTGKLFYGNGGICLVQFQR